jgi:hypothetical protein
MDLGNVVSETSEKEFEQEQNAIRMLDIVEAENKELIIQVKKLEFDCAEHSKVISDLNDRIKRLAMRTPSWPKGISSQSNSRS